ncbi:MAG: bifunctional nuclease family protein [Hydrogenothermaceae bacterium]|nr:bifunctional nuclease family protein [Hydrogenothermaceae bacterium]
MVEMEVQGITLDPLSNVPVVILRGKESDDILTVWIGVFEANSIAMKLECLTYPRPLTYELLVNIIENLSATVENIKIHSLIDNTYHAWITLRLSDGKSVEIDSRPSDAINVALRTGSPILVAEEVLSKAKQTEKEEISEDLRDWIESIKPEDFEKNIEF